MVHIGDDVAEAGCDLFFGLFDDVGEFAGFNDVELERLIEKFSRRVVVRHREIGATNAVIGGRNIEQRER